MATTAPSTLGQSWAQSLNDRTNAIKDHPANSTPSEVSFLQTQATFLQGRSELSEEIQTMLRETIEELNRAKLSYESWDESCEWPAAEEESKVPEDPKIQAFLKRNNLKISPEAPVPHLEGEIVQKDAFYGSRHFIELFNELRGYRRSYAEMVLTLNGLQHLWKEIEQNRFLNWEPNTPKFINHMIRNAVYRASREANRITPDQSFSVQAVLSEFPCFERKVIEFVDDIHFEAQVVEVGANMVGTRGLNGAICQVQTKGKNLIPFFLLFDGRQKDNEVFYVGFTQIDIGKEDLKWDRRLAIKVVSPQYLSKTFYSDQRLLEFSSDNPESCTLHLLKRVHP